MPDVGVRPIFEDRPPEVRIREELELDLLLILPFRERLEMLLRELLLLRNPLLTDRDDFELELRPLPPNRFCPKDSVLPATRQMAATKNSDFAVNFMAVS